MTTTTAVQESPARQRPAPSRAVDRARTAVVCLGLLAIVFSQQPGQIAPDTKLDLVVDPARFLSRSLHLWDPTAAFGMVQDQSYGYLFPMGPFFLVGHAIGLPAWAIQRLWQSGLLIVAFLGLRALANKMGIGSPTTRLIGAVGFALSPLIISKLGPISSEALTECVAPWVLLPLVGASATARPRRAAALSAVALLFAGGINAAATLAILPLPAFWLITRPAGPQRRRLVAWWLLCVTLASLWWALPLVEFGRYSPPFIDWIEGAVVTLNPTNLLSVLSGTEDWAGHLTSAEGPGWRAAWDLETQGVAVLDAVALAGLGLVGLLRRDLPERRFLVGAVLLGTVALTLGHLGAVGPAFSGNERHLLDGPAAAFRNIHKFDLVLRIPLALATIHVCTVVVSRVPSPLAQRFNLGNRARPLAIVACIAIIGIGLPLWQQDLEPGGTFSAIPTWWPQTASYLAAHADGTRALVLPAATHGDFAWGDPQDDPMQALATTPWVARDSVALGGAGERQLLDGIDAQVAVGRGGPALTAYLARAGIGWIVLRTDLDPNLAGNTPPIVVRAALQSSPGITQVASFGGSLDPVTGPTIQVYRVQGVRPVVSSAPVAGTVRLSGDAADLYQALSDGLLGDSTPVITAATPSVPGQDPASQARIVTDGNRRTETNFADVTDPVTATLLPGQPWSVARRVHQAGLADGAGHQTTAVLYGLRSVSASSSASDAGAYWVRDPAAGPVAAFDGNPATTWVSGAATAVGQWVQEDFVYPVAATELTLSAPSIRGIHSDVTQVRVTTSTGSELLNISKTAQAYSLPAGPTSSLRVTVTAVAGGGNGTTATLEATIPGAPIASEGLQVPADGSTLTGGRPGEGAAAVSFAGNPSSQGCISLQQPRRSICQPSLIQSSEDGQGIDRSFSVDRTSEYRLTMGGRALGGSALDAVLPQPKGLVVAVSSQLVPDPAAGEEALVDNDPATSWVAGASDHSPAVDIFSTKKRAISGLRLGFSPSASISPPATVRIDANGKSEQTAVPRDGVVRFRRPMTGKAFAVSFPKVRVRVEPGTTTFAPVGLTGLRVLSPHRRSQTTVSDATPFHLACGAGPTLSVNGTAVPTAVSGTVGDVMAGRDLRIRSCLGNGVQSVLLPAGAQRVRLATSATILPDSMTLTPLGSTDPTSAPAATSRSTRVLSWGSDSGRVSVGSGPASWLMLSENANAGWRASLDGHRLTATVLDGWRQAFLVPAGSGGTVAISYGPDRKFRQGLLLGAAAVLLLIVLAAWRYRSVALPVPVAAVTRRRRVGRAVLIGAAILAVPAFAGPAGGVIVLVVLIARLSIARWRPALVDALAYALVIGGLGVAATVGSLHPYFSPAGWGADTTTAQLGCAVALAALAVSLIPRRSTAETSRTSA